MSYQTDSAPILHELLMPVLLGSGRASMAQAKALHRRYGVDIFLFAARRPLFSRFRRYLRFSRVRNDDPDFDEIRVTALRRFAEARSEYLLCLLPGSPVEAAFVARNEAALSAYYLIGSFAPRASGRKTENHSPIPCAFEHDR